MHINMEKKTIKAQEEKLITARELFSMSFSTKELYSDHKIDEMKRKSIEKAKLKKHSLEFFENEGVIFYAETSVTKGKTFTIINYMKDYTLSTAGSLWKFGFVNKKTGQITLLFGGQCVAREQEAVKFFEIAKKIASVKYSNSKDLLTFAHKD